MRVLLPKFNDESITPFVCKSEQNCTFCLYICINADLYTSTSFIVQLLNVVPSLRSPDVMQSTDNDLLQQFVLSELLLM